MDEGAEVDRFVLLILSIRDTVVQKVVVPYNWSISEGFPLTYESLCYVSEGGRDRC